MIQLHPFVDTLFAYLGAIFVFFLIVCLISAFIFCTFLFAKGIVKLFNAKVIFPKKNKKGDD